jgi:chromosome segregation ATPase
LKRLRPIEPETVQRPKRKREDEAEATKRRRVPVPDDELRRRLDRARERVLRELEGALSQRKRLVDTQAKLHEAQKKLQCFRNYFSQLQLKFFHMSNDLRACKRDKEHLKTRHEALCRQQQSAQLRWLRCGSHVSFLKHHAIL